MKLQIKKLKQVKAASVISLSVFLLVLIFPFSKTLELKTRDFRSILSGPAKATAPVVIVAIDDASFEAINIRWPWPREILGKAVLKLSAAGARVIAPDIMLGDKGYTPGDDVILAGAMQIAGNVVLPAKFGQKTTGDYTVDYYDQPLDIFKRQSISMGYVNLPVDSDSLVREFYPFNRNLDNARQVEAAFGVASLLASDTRWENNDLVIKLREMSDLKKMKIHYAEPGAFEVISFYKVLKYDFEPEIFKDKIVLIGAMFKESHDILMTPLETSTGLYGVEIHANIINTLYNGDEITESPAWFNFIFLVVLIIASAFYYTRSKPLPGLVVFGASVVGYILLAVWLFSSYLHFIRLIDPFLGMFFCWVGGVVYRYAVVNREQKQTRDTFARYVAPSIVDMILEDTEQINLGGETKDVVIFFSDIVGFTPLSEKMQPGEVVEMLNRYFTEMTEIIFKYEGTFNKYIGDAIMAFFGAPVAVKNPSEKAVRACLEMRQKIEEINSERVNENKLPIHMGMALHRGNVLVGNIGSPRQMEYTIIGDDVNVCSRIEGLTRQFQTDILISDALYQDVKDIVEVTTHEPVMVKGKSLPITVHSVVGLKKESV